MKRAYELVMKNATIPRTRHGLLTCLLCGVVACGGTGGAPLDDETDPTEDRSLDEPAVDSIFPCTEEGIRDAISTGGGPHAFSCDGPTTIRLEAGLVIDNDVALDGLGELTVHGDDQHRVLTVTEGASVKLRGLVVSGGEDCDGAAGIENHGVLTLDECAVVNNQGCQVGGIWNGETGWLILRDSVVSGNVGDGVGGIANDGTMNAIRTKLSGNRGRVGAFHNRHVLRVESGTVAENTGESAGGILNDELGLLLMRDAIVSGNSAEQVGGILNRDAKVAITRTTLTANEGGIVGALYSESQWAMSLVDSNIADNVGSVTGIHNEGGGSVTMSGTVILDQCAGVITSDGSNMMRDEGPTCGFDATKGDVKAL